MNQDPKSSTTFTYHDPSRCFEGTPYQAAGMAVDQSRRVMRLLALALRQTNVQARNAYMSRRLDTGHEKPEAIRWQEEAEARSLEHVISQVSKMEQALVGLDRKLKAVEKAASYDPKNPPKDDAE